MGLGFVVHVILSKIPGLRLGRGLVRDFATGRIDYGALPGGDSGTGDGMVLNVVDRLVETGAVVSLKIRMTVWESRNGAAFDYGRLVIGKVLALAGRRRRGERDGHDEG